MAESKPGFWAHLPAKVRYDAGLPPNAKLLYAEITALEDSTGYCFAQNRYFCEVFSLSERTVTGLIAKLVQRGYIQVEIIRDPASNEVKERRITAERPELLSPDDEDECADPPAKNCHTPPEKICYTPPAKNCEYNDINNINVIPPITPHKGGRHERAKNTAAWMPERFEKFWEYYRKHARDENRRAAIKAWDKLQPSPELISLMGQKLKQKINSPMWRQGIGIPYASTWLNQRRWEENGVVMPPEGAEKDSWADDPEVINDA